MTMADRVNFSILLLVPLFFNGVLSQQFDLTRTANASGSEVVGAVVDILKRTCIFPDDILYVRRVAYVESHDGLDADTYSTGFDGGIWRVDKATYDMTVSDPDLAHYRDDINRKLHINWTTTSWSDLRKPLYSGIAAELAAIMKSGNGGIPITIETQATFWAENGTTANVFVRLASELKKSRVYLTDVDVVFVLDSSASLSLADFEKTKEFVEKVVEGFDIDNDKVRVAVVEYSSTYYPKFGLDNGMSGQDMLTTLANITYIPGGTNTKAALDYVNREVFQEQNGARNNSAKIVVLVTDGRSDDKTATVDSAKALKNSGVDIFTVGVGSLVDKAELDLVASEPKCVHVKTVSNYTDLPAVNYEIQQLSLQSSVILKPGTYNFSCGSMMNIQVLSNNGDATTVEVKTDSGNYALFGTGNNAYRPSSVLYGFRDNITSRVPVQLYIRDGSRVSLAFRNTTNGGCNSYFQVKVLQGDHITLGSHVTCIDAGLISKCTPADLVKSPFVITGTPQPGLQGICTSSDTFVAPHPIKADRYLYCQSGTMIVVYCRLGQIFDVLSSQCVHGNVVPVVSTLAPQPTGTTATTGPTPQPPVTLTPPAPSNPPSPPSLMTNPCTPDHISQALFIWPYPADNTKFIKCGIFPYAGAVLSCPEHKYYSDPQKTCLYIEVVVDPTKDSYSSINNPCMKNYPGDVQYHPYPSDQTKFIQCDPFGDAFIKDCRAGEIWEQTILNCIPNGFNFQTNPPIVGR